MVKKDINEEQWNELIEKYKNGAAGTAMCKEYNITYYTLRKKLDELDIPTNNKKNNTVKVGRKNTYDFNEDFFEVIDSEEKAYWLGFIYADGYITENNKCGISLKSVDIGHLEKFKKSIKSNHKISIYESQYNEKCNITEYCRIILTSKKNVDNLMDKGVSHRKSLILKFPNKEIFKNQNDIIHFIRGYFDGDGSIIGGGIPRISFVGTKEFLEKLVELFPFKTNASIIKDNRTSDTYEIKFGSKEHIKIFLNWLYFGKDCKTFLDRKYKLAQEYLSKYSNM